MPRSTALSIRRFESSYPRLHSYPFASGPPKLMHPMQRRETLRPVPLRTLYFTTACAVGPSLKGSPEKVFPRGPLLTFNGRPQAETAGIPEVPRAVQARHCVEEGEAPRCPRNLRRGRRRRGDRRRLQDKEAGEPPRESEGRPCRG